MPDDRTKKGPQDRSKINTQEPYEVRYWATKFGVPERVLVEIAKKHGPKASDIEKAIKAHKRW